MPQIQIIGVYPVEAPEPVHLVEISVRDAESEFALDQFTQAIGNRPRSDWQAPYMEQILNAEGTDIIADDCKAFSRPELFCGDVRFVFFFHYLDFHRPFRTPFGEMTLPIESELPARLSMIQYEEH